MYNYFMLIGVVEGYQDTKDFFLELKVDRWGFPKGADHFKIRVFNPFIDLAKEIPFYDKKVSIKGRIVQTDNGLELVAERVITM